MVLQRDCVNLCSHKQYIKVPVSTHMSMQLVFTLFFCQNLLTVENVKAIQQINILVVLEIIPSFLLFFSAFF